MIFNLGSSSPTFALEVYGYPKATVTVTNGKQSYTKTTDSNGSTIFEKLAKGIWNVTASDGSVTNSYSVEVGKNKDNKLNINVIPEISYVDGIYAIVDDNDKPITASLKNWKIRFLKTGKLTFKKLNGAANGIDVFAVGGGANSPTAYLVAGCGGGGGKTSTKRNVPVVEGEGYYISVAGSGGTSSALGCSAGPGSGANGGSGGGTMCANGGKDGADGAVYSGTTWTPGKGQHSTTREFGESNGKLYAGGGGGGGSAAAPGKGGDGGGGYGCWKGAAKATDGSANTGGGAGGCSSDENGVHANTVALGGSGIVIIRNKR